MSHHLLRAQLCCLEADDVMFRDKSLLPLHQAFFLGGWPGGPLCIWEAPSLQAVPNHKCVRAGYAPAPNKSSMDCAAGSQVPISIHPAPCVSQGAFATTDLGKHQPTGSTVPGVPSVTSSHFYFMQLSTLEGSSGEMPLPESVG